MTTADDESGRREANRTQAAREARAWVARLTSGSATQADADALAIRRSLDLRHFSGERLAGYATRLSNCTGLRKSSAEWRRTGL